MGIIQNLQESLGHVPNNMSRLVFTEAIRTKTEHVDSHATSSETQTGI